MKTLICLLLMILIGTAYGLAQEKLSLETSAEFQINTTIDSVQRSPDVAGDGKGNFAVVWTSEEQAGVNSKTDIYLQRFNDQNVPVGTEQIVNLTIAGIQKDPVIAMNSKGDFVVAWSSFSSADSMFDIRARIYTNDGQPGDELLVNTTVEHSQTNPAVAITDDGRFIIVWTSWHQDGSDRGIFAQMFTSSGDKEGSEFQVNTTVSYSQARPAVACKANGDFVVVWESWNQDNGTPVGYGVFGQILTANGTGSGEEFQINTYVDDYQWFADLTTFSDAGFAVTWCSWEQDGWDGGIYLQRFDENGTKAGGEILVNRSTAKYQWLPKIERLENDNFVVVWSSWEQDGSREGIFAQLFNKSGEKISFETPINSYYQNYQWEPAVCATNGNKFITVWASWGQAENDYEIMGRAVELINGQGTLEDRVVTRPSGSTTSSFILHVIDSTALTGEYYELTFDQLSEDAFNAKISKKDTGTPVIDAFPIDKGEGIFYLTPVFDGLAMEIQPEFDLDLDFENSFFINNSGTGWTFEVVGARSNKNVAPVDIALIWGSTDTLGDGSYAAPLDTALGPDATRSVEIPFTGWDLTNKKKVVLFIPEPTATRNKHWDVGEVIYILTPEPYSTKLADTHATITNSLDPVNTQLPDFGDTLMVFTTRPLSDQDTVVFRADADAITGVAMKEPLVVEAFQLYQNFPNPFNPSTTIRYSLPVSGHVTISIYNILGQRVTTLVNERQISGLHRVKWDINQSGKSLSTGLYIARLQVNGDDGRIFTRSIKSILVR